jgi:hypothetical protein
VDSASVSSKTVLTSPRGVVTSSALNSLLDGE